MVNDKILFENSRFQIAQILDKVDVDEIKIILPILQDLIRFTKRHNISEEYGKYFEDSYEEYQRLLNKDDIQNLKSQIISFLLPKIKEIELKFIR